MYIFPWIGVCVLCIVVWFKQIPSSNTIFYIYVDKHLKYVLALLSRLQILNKDMQKKALSGRTFQNLEA